MREFKVALARSYIVTIEAENEEDARRFCEFYLGDCPDASAPEDRKERQFAIHGIEMTVNDAIDIEEVTSEESN